MKFFKVSTDFGTLPKSTLSVVMNFGESAGILQMLARRRALQYAVGRHKRTRPRRLRAVFRRDGILIATPRVKTMQTAPAFR